MERIVTETVLLPHIIASTVIGELCRHLGEAFARELDEDNLSESMADALADRAERVYINNARFRHQTRGEHGREHLQMFMRHWLSAEVQRRLPAYYPRIPEQFKIGSKLV